MTSEDMADGVLRMANDSLVQQAIHDLNRLRRNEIDDCGRAIRGDDLDRARRELDDVDTKIRRIIALLQSA